MRSLLVRGLIAGLLAGVVAFGIAKLVGEPAVDKAIAFEEYVASREHGEAAGEHSDGETLVARSQQRLWGLGTGSLIYGTAVGGIFAVVFGIAYGRLGPLTARGTAAVLGLLGFITVAVVPALKYPASPPAIGNPDTIDRRTTLFLLMILLSVTCAAVAVVMRRRITVRLGGWNATIAAGLAYLVAMIICYVALPAVNDVPQAFLRGVVPATGETGITFPPSVLWRFRVSSIAVQAGLWSALALSFGWFAERVFVIGPDVRRHAPSPNSSV